MVPGNSSAPGKTKKKEMGKRSRIPGMIGPVGSQHEIVSAAEAS